MAQQLSWRATHDALTGLINRREFANHLTQLILRAGEKQEQHVLLYLDLDQLLVNDACGHVAGDELLKQPSSVIRGGMRESDAFARMADETGQPVRPGAFLPAAERYGTMPSFDRWVVRNLFKQLVRIQTIAEFIEDAAILACLRTVGVDFAQGYHINHSHPFGSAG